MKKRIAVVTTTAAIDTEKGLNRMYFLADLLARNGYDVDFITSDFQHWTKSYRNIKEIEKLSVNCNIILLHETGYKKNVDVRRIISHYFLANNIRKYLKMKEYDLIYSDLPDNHVSVVCGKYAKRKGIPYIADIEDLWPKAMKMVFDIPILSNVLFFYFSHDAKKTYKLASAIVGSSDTYRDDPYRYGVEVSQRITVYVGNDLKKFDIGASNNAKNINKEEGDFWITYAGSLGASYDLKTLIVSADRIKKMGIDNIHIMLLGDGPQRKELENLAKSLSGNVIFKGYIPFEEMAGYLIKSDVVINSVRKNAPQSIVSKIGDYLASGKPMINTCVDAEFWKKVEVDGFGINVEPENADTLTEVILKLQEDPELCRTLGEKARIIAEQQFDRNNSFMKIVNLIDRLINNEESIMHN